MTESSMYRPLPSRSTDAGPGTDLAGTGLSWGCVPELDLIALAETAARNGFPEITAKPAQYFATRRERGWRQRLDATGVRVGIVDALMTHLPGSPRPEDVPENLRASYTWSAEDCIEAALDLGARTINVAHFLGRPDVGVDEMASAVATLGDLVGQAGLRACLEFIPGTGLPDLATTHAVVESAGSDAVGIMFDTWHHIRSGRPAEEASGPAAAHVIEVQISGWRPPPPGEPYVPMTGRLLPGEGTPAVAEMVRRLRSTQPDLALGLEVFSSDRGDADARVARLADATRAFLAGYRTGPTTGSNA